LAPVVKTLLNTSEMNIANRFHANFVIIPPSHKWR
jgi:hypothetical protein